MFCKSSEVVPRGKLRRLFRPPYSISGVKLGLPTRRTRSRPCRAAASRGGGHFTYIHWEGLRRVEWGSRQGYGAWTAVFQRAQARFPACVSVRRKEVQLCRCCTLRGGDRVRRWQFNRISFVLVGRFRLTLRMGRAGLSSLWTFLATCGHLQVLHAAGGGRGATTRDTSLGSQGN